MLYFGQKEACPRCGEPAEYVALQVGDYFEDQEYSDGTRYMPNMGCDCGMALRVDGYIAVRDCVIGELAEPENN